MKTKPLKIIHTNIYAILIPKEAYQSFAEKKMNRVKVSACYQEKTINFYAAVKKDKVSEDYKMMFSKQKQKELGLTLGNKFTVQLFEDTSKYGVEIPEELEAVLLSDYEAYVIFESLTKGKQRSIIYYILRLKNIQKRIDQSLLLCENLKRGNTQNKELFQAL